MELPLIKEIWNHKRNKGFSVILINNEPQQPGAAEFLQKEGLDYPHLKEINYNYRRDVINAIKFTGLWILLDSENRVLKTYYGFHEEDLDFLEKSLDILLAE